ncbi:ABC transporter permease [Merismopedia glauca]|uniref:Polysialic acid transporter n=1 Tax=Merismopedia glauca CCAP 1448/3 TaxID=1296344 RepID=A0A2T1C772_9CYAN|nr:ABC transporter permease [Merismopedia glauca]PSB04132.1 polysialic acid transporter [Merismopedia glauca CCAP 1448/3]
MSTKSQRDRLEVIYTPDSRIHHPLQLFQEMYRDLLAARELAWRLLFRNIKAQYQQSFLGIAWALIPPALTAGGFAFANHTGLLNIGQTEIPYPAYVMLGTTLWQTFLEAFNGPQIAINTSRTLLSQVKFPHEAIILSQVGQILFNLTIKLLFVVILFLVFHVQVSWTVILVPFSLIGLVALGISLGLLLVPITNLIQDISRTLEIVMLGWFFITPVAYPVPTHGILSVLVGFNPVTPLLVTTRELMTTGVVSSPSAFFALSILSLFGLGIGWVVFRLAIPFLVERIS